MMSQQETSRVVYVVDDDPATCESLCAVLQAHEISARAYSSAEEFLTKFDAAQAGCVITDFKMPGMNGMQLQQELRLRSCSLPVIIVTGYADVPMAVRAMEQGAVTLLEKPYQPSALLDAVQRALEMNASQRQKSTAQADFERRLAKLSERERRIMDLLVSGKSNKVVASELDLGLRTVERRRKTVLDKMGVSSLPELAAFLARRD